MSIIAVPDHFYYSSLRSLQSASKLSGNEIPVLKAQVQIEGHQLHWQGAISSAIQRCHCLPTCSSKVFSSVFVAITALCCAHSSPSESLCCLGLPHSIKNVSGRLLSRCLSSQVLHPQVHALSQTESCNLFLSCLVFPLHVILSSAILLNLAGLPSFTSYTIPSSGNRIMIWNATRPGTGTQPNTSKKTKKASESSKKERLYRNDATLSPFHISSTGTGYPALV